MKTLLLLATLFASQNAFSYPSYTACGTYKVLPSCGGFPALTPVIVTDYKVVYLSASCDVDNMNLCSLRNSLLKMMKEGEKYCATGSTWDDYKSPCADLALNFDNVEKI